MSAEPLVLHSDTINRSCKDIMVKIIIQSKSNIRIIITHCVCVNGHYFDGTDLTLTNKVLQFYS